MHDDLQPVREAFERYGREDPMYAALSRSGTTGNRWDPDAFFETGRREIGDVVAYVRSLGLTAAGDRALDFGCAVGRLTQALANHFDTVVGIDIATAMVERAREYNRHPEQVTYILNTAPDLALLESGSCDFVYSNKVLQHIRPAVQLGFIAEFVRVLRPGAVAVFQVRNGPRVLPGTLRAWLYRMNRIHLRRLGQRIRRRPPYEMHYIARADVESAVSDAGGRIVDVVDLSRGRRNRSLRYCVERTRA
jgi:2-polyprenyl-3-methyl-5-hydroxy-6-metoxy-1,4-benzoquinol methylase